MFKRKAFAVSAVLLLLASQRVAGATTVQSGARSSACSVRTIYVSEFGQDPRYVNFRLDLEKWLAKRKFGVTRRPEEADAVLAGKLTIGSGAKYSYLSLKGAELRPRAGASAWRGDFDFKTKQAFGWLGRGHIENGAKRIAEDVRANCR